MPYQVMTGRFVARAGELALLRELLGRAAAGEPLDHAQQQLEQPSLAGARDLLARGPLAAPGKVG